MAIKVTKRLIVATLLLPVTLLLLAFGSFMEWFHFTVSASVLRLSRTAERRYLDLFKRLD